MWAVLGQNKLQTCSTYNSHIVSVYLHHPWSFSNWRSTRNCSGLNSVFSDLYIIRGGHSLTEELMPAVKSWSCPCNNAHTLLNSNAVIWNDLSTFTSSFILPNLSLVLNVSLSLSLCLQPDELTNVLEICNIVFTSMFTLEMILKLTAFGFFEYLRNPYNIFDGIIVIIRQVHSLL